MWYCLEFLSIHRESAQSLLALREKWHLNLVLVVYEEREVARTRSVFVNNVYYSDSAFLHCFCQLRSTIHGHGAGGAPRQAQVLLAGRGAPTGTHCCRQEWATHSCRQYV
jgi:hypothetical protein